MHMDPQVLRQWMYFGGIGVGSALAAALVWIAVAIYRRPSAQQIEERRRERLASFGRIVDGTLIDADPLEATPQKIVYTYRIAGVSYECSQDVSMLGALVKNIRLDYPVQVRYNRANPADSIVVAETWNGLWKRVENGSRQLRTVQDS